MKEVHQHTHSFQTTSPVSFLWPRSSFFAPFSLKWKMFKQQLQSSPCILTRKVSYCCLPLSSDLKTNTFYRIFSGNAQIMSVTQLNLFSFSNPDSIKTICCCALWCPLCEYFLLLFSVIKHRQKNSSWFKGQFKLAGWMYPNAAE